MAGPMAFLEQFKEPLLMSYTKGETGDMLADWLIRGGKTTGGRATYDKLKAAGKDQILMLLQMYEPIWSVVSLTLDNFSTYVDEFLDYDNIVAKQQAEEEAQEAAQPVATPITARPKQPKTITVEPEKPGA